MRNWSVDEEQFKKENPAAHQRWRLEQLINYGLDNEKISEQELRANWHKLSLDSARRRFLALLLQ